MPCWYYDKKELRNTPSIQDAIDYDTECRYRREGARFIIDSGTKMDLGYNTMATGVVYFHRFYMFHSFRNFPRYVTACCCLFLAGKVEETPKKCKDIIKTARMLLVDQKFQTFGEDPKEEVMTLERILLQTIKFDLQVEHPYGYLLKYAKCLKGDKNKLQKMVQMAWTFVNDSLCTTLCLQWEPEIIAVALMYLAGKLSKFEVLDWSGRQAKHLRWWDMFVEDVTMELLEDICHQVLDLYSQPQSAISPDSPPPPPPADGPLPAKRDRISQPVSPAGLPMSPAAAVIPVKLNKMESRGHTPGALNDGLTNDIQTDRLLPTNMAKNRDKMSNLPRYGTYQLSAPASGLVPPPSAFPPTYSTQMPPYPAVYPPSKLTVMKPDHYQQSTAPPYYPPC